MDEKLSRRIALQLVDANSAADVARVLEDSDASYYFGDPQNWSPYGNREKNWDTVGNQQTNPVGSLVELITNGIDAILLRRATEEGIKDMRGPSAPASMHEAVKLFFPHVNEGKIAKLGPEERSRLAVQCIQVGIRRAERKNHIYPTY